LLANWERTFLEGVADVDQVGDAQVEHGDLGADEGEVVEVAVEEVGKTLNGVEDSLAAGEEQVAEVEQVLREEIHVERRAGQAGQRIADGDIDIEGQAGQRVDPGDRIGDVDAIEMDIAAPVGRGDEHQRVFDASLRCNWPVVTLLSVPATVQETWPLWKRRRWSGCRCCPRWR